ncbi:Mediator of RNA polymerase II transcription subunit 4 like protein [Verticillium longisporum]|nr:Mediator of RNA polymerase II transcription subunit 4 like protein [Verticillium longisporum]
MDEFIDARFERVEKALASLVESVSKYHPYAKQALDLQEADKELSQGLELVQQHQNNHLRLQELRTTSSALDAQIRETLSTLASTRRDITTTHITVHGDEDHYPIKYEELLNYARRISKTTLPPAGVTNGVTFEPAASEDPPAGAVTNGVQSAVTSAAPTPSGAPTPGAPTPGAQTPAAPTPTAQQLPDPSSGPNGATSQPPEQPGAAPGDNPSGAPLGITTALPSGLRDHLDANHGTIFLPWPNEYQIGGGALAACQDLSERGIDPRGYDPVAVAAEAKRREEEDKAAKAELERRKAEETRRKREEWEANQRRRAAEAAQKPEPSATSPAPAAGKNAQFQFTSMDMDDDDDD